MGLYSFEEISEIELNSLKQVLDATTEIDISQSDQKRLDCRYSLGSINENEPIQIRKELSSCQIIDNQRTIYKNGDFLYEYSIDRCYIYKILRLKPIENIKRCINPLKFVRFFETLIPLDSVQLLSETTSYTITPFVTSAKRITRIVYDTLQREWTYFLEDKDVSNCLEERISHIGYLSEWLDSLGDMNTHKQSQLFQNHLEKMKLLGNSNMNESITPGPIGYKYNEGHRHYLTKLPDNIMYQIKNRCYVQRISCYNKHKTKGGLIRMAINENYREKHGITPALTDGYHGFEFQNSIRIKNWCGFFNTTLSAGSNMNHTVIPGSFVGSFAISDIEFRINGFDSYKEVWVEDDNLFMASYMVPMFI